MAFTDDFTGSDGDDLEGRTGWTRVDGVAGAAEINASNQLKFSSATDTAYQAPDAGTADHYAQADLEYSFALTRNFFAWCVNVQDKNNFVGGRIRASARQLYKRIGGTLSQLASEADASGTGTTMKVVRNGTSVELYVATVLELTGSIGTELNTIQTPGLVCRSNTQDPCIDNWESQEAAGGDALVLNNVQTGTIAFGAANTSRNVTITSVDTAKCFILIDWQTDSTASVATTQHYRARLSSSTNIAIDRTAAVSGDDGLVRWWAVEFSAGLTVRHFTGTSRNTNVSIGATVDLAKTFAIISDRPQTFDYDDSQIEGVDIVSTTNFQVKTDSTAESAPNWAVQIIEFDAAADPVVEPVTITLSGGTTSNTGSISAITVADSMLIGSGTWSEALGNANQMGFSAALDNTTTVSVTRVTGTGTLVAYMFVIDWGANIDIRSGTDTLTTGEGTSETQTFSALGGTGDAIAFMRGGSGTFGAQSNHTGSPDDADYAEISLDSVTQITITRSGTGQDLGPYNWQVIDFAGFAVAGVATRRYSLSLVGVG